MRCNVEIIHEVKYGEPGEWALCFHWARYHYDDGTSQTGYRFMWRRPENSLQPAMGQARIPDASWLFKLIQLATEAGWFITAEANADDEQAPGQIEIVEEDNEVTP